MPSKRIIFRADASAEIGTGHVMRCLALAQALIDGGGEAIFAMSEVTEKLAERLEKEKCKIIRLDSRPYGEEDVNETGKIAQELNVSWVIIDGYNFGAKYQAFWKEKPTHTLFVDDYGHAGYYCTDAVLNQSLYAHEELYRERDPYTNLLLGTPYVMLRREFLQYRRNSKSIPEEAKHIVVTLGGADIRNITKTVIETLQKLSQFDTETKVVVGGSSPHMEELKELTEKSPVPMELLYNIKNMPELMSWADLAISAGGTTCYELSFMGVPTIALILADNQVAFAEQMDASGTIKSLGKPSPILEEQLAEELERMITDREARTNMIKQQSALVDGYGVDRILMHLFDEELRLREANESDEELLLSWSNDPVTRQSSFSSSSIKPEEHSTWFQNKLNDPNSLLFVGVNQDEREVGIVRFDLEGNEADISISISPNHRQQGLGQKLLELGCEILFAKTDVSLINAYVKPQNVASMHLFEKIGFNQKEQTYVKEQEAAHFALSRV